VFWHCLVRSNCPDQVQTRIKSHVRIGSEFIERLNREINAGLADPKIKKRLTDLGGLPIPMTPTEFGKLITDETERWTKVVRSANIKAD
jgi:tripartite-type tricarboxylate transporter receptor subunit TctC